MAETKIVSFALTPGSAKHPEDAALLAIIEGWEKEGHGKKVAHFRRAIRLEAGIESPALYDLLKQLLTLIQSGVTVATPQQQEALDAVLACDPERWNL